MTKVNEGSRRYHPALSWEVWNAYNPPPRLPSITYLVKRTYRGARFQNGGVQQSLSKIAHVFHLCGPTKKPLQQLPVTRMAVERLRNITQRCVPSCQPSHVMAFAGTVSTKRSSLFYFACLAWHSLVHASPRIHEPIIHDELLCRAIACDRLLAASSVRPHLE